MISCQMVNSSGFNCVCFCIRRRARGGPKVLASSPSKVSSLLVSSSNQTFSLWILPPSQKAFTAPKQSSKHFFLRNALTTRPSLSKGISMIREDTSWKAQSPRLPLHFKFRCSRSDDLWIQCKTRRIFAPAYTLDWWLRSYFVASSGWWMRHPRLDHPLLWERYGWAAENAELEGWEELFQLLQMVWMRSFHAANYTSSRA